MFLRRLAMLVSILLLCAPFAARAAQEGQPTPEALREVEEALEADRAEAEALSREAETLGAELQGIKSELILAARKAQDLEDELSRIEQTLTVLEIEEIRARSSLRERRTQMARIIQGLQRMALLPRESLILRPGSPLELARGNLVLQAALPRIEEEARKLRADLSDLASLRREIEQQRQELYASETALSEEQRRLAALLARKEDLQAATNQELAAARARAEELSRKAADLRDLMDQLEKERLLSSIVLPREKPQPPQRSLATAAASEGAERQQEQAEIPESAPQTALLAPSQPPQDLRPFPESPGSLVLPARGRILRRFGEALPQSLAGGNAKGLYLEARPGAQVVAPYDGKVVYAQPFRGYGLILIIEHSGQYHSLLSGFERVDAVEGQWVLAGEPVGVLGQPAAGNPELYIELRRDGRPIDPLPWLALGNEKVKS